MYVSEQIPQGWQCPKCYKIYNPVKMECTNCNTTEAAKDSLVLGSDGPVLTYTVATNGTEPTD